MGGGAAVPLSRGELVLRLTQRNVASGEAYLHVKFHLDPSNRLASVQQCHRHRQDRPFDKR